MIDSFILGRRISRYCFRVRYKRWVDTATQEISLSIFFARTQYSYTSIHKSFLKPGHPRVKSECYLRQLAAEFVPCIQIPTSGVLLIICRRSIWCVVHWIHMLSYLTFLTISLTTCTVCWHYALHAFMPQNAIIRTN
jgi:hypothetical protein